MRGGGNWLPLYAILVALILLIKGSECLVAFWRRRRQRSNHIPTQNEVAAADFSSN